jgi:hypothetical protein
MWSSAARTDALARVPTDLQSRQPVTPSRQISARFAFAFAARYLTRPSWGRERHVPIRASLASPRPSGRLAMSSQPADASAAVPSTQALCWGRLAPQAASSHEA